MKKKLKLEEIELKSFVTNSADLNSKTINGGGQSDQGTGCITINSITPTPGTTPIGILTAVQGTYHLTAIFGKIIEGNGANTESGYNVACSRFNCNTYKNLGIEC